MRRRLTILAGVACLAIAGAVAIVLSPSDHRRTSTDPSRLLNAGGDVPPGGSACQPGETIAPGTGGAVVYVSGLGHAAGPLEVKVTKDGTPVAEGRTARGDYDSRFAIPVEFPLIEHELEGARVCVTNRGSVPVRLFGQGFNVSTGTATFSAGGEPVPIALRFDYLTRERLSWWSFAGEVAARDGALKATFFGSWTMWLALAVLAAICFGSVLYVAREPGA